MKIKKIIASTLIIITIFLNTPKSYAIFGVGDISFDPTAFAQALIAYAQDAASYVKENYSTVLQNQVVVKEYGLDKLAQVLAKQALKKMQQSTLTWIKSGYHGSPSFISNPETFFGNIAVTELRGITSQLTTELSYANRSIAAELIRSTQANTTFYYAPTIDLTVRNNICNESKTQFLVDQAARARSSDNDDIYEIQAQQKAYVDELCSGPITEEKYQALKKCFKNDFNCGGWDAFNAMTQDPRNDDNYRLQKAREALYKNTADTEQKVKDDLARGNGFLSFETCPDEKYKDQENKKGCINPVYTTPGKVAADLVSSAVTSPTRQGELADEINEILDAAVSGFIDNIVNQGFTIAADTVNSAVNSVNEDLAKLDGGLADTINNLPPIPTQPQPGDLTNAELNGVVAPMLSAMKVALSEHKLGGDAIREELAFYQGFVNYVNQIPQCYANKRAQEEDYIRRGQKAPPAEVAIPDDVNNYLNSSLANAQNKLSSVTTEYNNYIKDTKGLEDAINIISKIRNGAQIQAIYLSFVQDSSSGRYQSIGTSNIRKNANLTIFDNLNTEKDTVAKRYLDQCNAINPQTYRSGSGSSSDSR